MSWYPVPVPSQAGRRFLVTGANRGLGFFTAARLARAGGHVVLAGRSPERADAAVRAIRDRVPAASVGTLVLDTASLDSVAAAAAEVLAGPPLDGLVLNAGMVHTPGRRLESVDGNELVLATNVLGHFALLGRVLPHVADGGRIVSLGSLSTRLSTLRVDDLQLTRGYTAWRAYAQSKIAAQSIGFELDRRLRAAEVAGRGAAGSGAGATGVGGSSPRVSSVVADPGYSISGRTPAVPGVSAPAPGSRFADALQSPWAQGKHRGADTIVFAATAADVASGQLWGPRFGTKGAPALRRPTRTSSNPEVGARVWAFAEAATGVHVEARA